VTRNTENAKRFAAKILTFATERYPGLAAQISAEFAAEVITRVIPRTPVDTGRARANWQVAYFGAAVPQMWHTFDRGGAATIARELAKLKNLKPFQNVRISNALPYAIPLERGHSRQAPAGMLAITLAEVRARAKQIGARGADKWRMTGDVRRGGGRK